MSPLGTVCTLKPKHERLSAQERMAVQAKQGRAVFGVDMKIVGEEGQELPRDGNLVAQVVRRARADRLRIRRRVGREQLHVRPAVPVVIAPFN